MSLLDLGPVAFGGYELIVPFLQDKHVLAERRRCGCGSDMALARRADVSDGVRWRCPDCHKCTSIRKDSFLEKSKITLQKNGYCLFTGGVGSIR